MLFLSSNNQVIQWELSEVRTSIQGDEILEIYVFIEESDADKYVFESLGLKKMHYKRGFFYPSDVTKVEGVESLLSKDFHEISLDSIIVFGDGKNDYSLFKKSKISIAMQKSDKILKEVATECLIDQTLSQYLSKICVVQS